MKRFVLMIASLLFASLAFANPVSESTAKSLAENFLQRPSARMTFKGKVPAQTLGKKRVALKASAAAEPAYYVFNFDGGGWVIIAGEDSVEPVLAYSRNGYFTLEGAPSNLKWWMEGLAGEIGAIRSGESAPAPVARKAAGSVRKIGAEVVNHHTARWDQYEPYNNECPNNGRDESGNTMRSVTGCVATAGAIVAKFFEWPTAAEGVTEAYSYTSDDTGTKQTIPAVTLGRTYDWANMLQTYGSNYTSAQGAAVAALMADLGRASMMGYNYDAGSGTFDQNLLLAFQKHFKYNKKAYHASRYGYSDAEWLALMKSQLDSHPIVYGGVAGRSGHEFVLEGYTTDNYFLVNWGWGGYGDGSFLIDRLTLDSYTFSDEQSTLIDLVPDRNGSTSYADNIVITPFSTQYPGLYSYTSTYTQNTAFRMRVSNYYNNATMPFTGNLYLAVYDKNGNWKENISAAKAVSNMENAFIAYIRADYDEDAFVEEYWTNISCTIKNPIKGGDRIRLHYEGQYSSGYARSDNEQGVWEIVISNASGPSADEIAESVSFGWKKATRTITTATSLSDGISLTIKNAAGTTVYSVAGMEQNRVYSIDCSSFAKGSYSIIYGGGEDYTLMFTL